MSFSEYLNALRKNLAQGDATEHTHRPALHRLLEQLRGDLIATNEPRRIACGAPDFSISRKKTPLGHIETKDIGANLDEIERGRGPHGEQFKRYRDGLPNWVLTDYLEFRWFVAGEKRLTARLGELDGKGKIRLLPDGEEQVGHVLDAFFRQPALTVESAKDLAQRMAGLTKIVRDIIIATLKHDTGSAKKQLENWLKAFQEVLIPDLNQEQFADMFAQTLAYGLFAARVHSLASDKPFTRETAAHSLPRTNPFLRKLFDQITGVDMPETLAWAAEDIILLLRHADWGKVLRDFGRGKTKEDPVVHFYETFLAAYDPKMRKVRGVYYTPEPVVSYIVRSVDKLLQTQFGKPKGLADEKTLILDPAVGTATFLYFVIQHIYRSFGKQRGAWDSYVSEHLLDRIFGFELLMAPYAVAHLKLGMELQETGYNFGSEQRLGIYLTNTLDEAAQKSERLLAQWIADEANAAADIKRERPILVVLGNPPYSGISANRTVEIVEEQKTKVVGGKTVPIIRKGRPVVTKRTKKTFIGQLMEDYKKVDGAALGERKHWLQDDYAKFIRFAQWRLDRTQEGILAFVTNHGYLGNPTFRGMRRSLMSSFTEIFVYDLHGNLKRKETAPGGGKDQNVFDIQQGVAILLAVKLKGQEKGRYARVHHADLWGLRSHKNAVLQEESLEKTKWTRIEAKAPLYLFQPYDDSLEAEYRAGISIADVFSLHGVGCVTARDQLTIAPERQEIWDRVNDFANLGIEEARRRYSLGDDARDWKVKSAQADITASGPSEEHLTEILVHPFDHRWTYYTGRARGFYASPCAAVMKHLLVDGNLGLICSKRVEIDEFEHVFCTHRVIQHHTTSLKEVSYLFPLYLYAAADMSGTKSLFAGRRSNLSANFLTRLREKLGLIDIDSSHETIFGYLYAVLHAKSYRLRYAEYLKRDFPRVPLTSDRALFVSLANKGHELIALHLMESPVLDNLITEFPTKASNEVEKVAYTPQNRRVWINPQQYFGGVPEDVWEFHVGGYQVLEKWLKDRKGRKLTYDDIQHWQKVVVALKETKRLMQEIDELIPGWPLP